MRWRGFRNVRKQVCKRLGRRVRELSLRGLSAYRAYLEKHPEEWAHLESLCRITISRFYRDRGVFDLLSQELLPSLVRLARKRGDPTLRVWSAGCGAGEEPYTLSIVCHTHSDAVVSRQPLEIIGTDIDGYQVERGRQAVYPQGCAREIPPHLRERGFEQQGALLRVRSRFRKNVDLRQQNIRHAMPTGPFHLIFCRNLIFTYFDRELQHELGSEIAKRLVPQGVLVIGKHEVLPSDLGLEVLDSHHRLYRAPGCEAVVCRNSDDPTRGRREAEQTLI
jgi:chemotaxis protein methyltransferase CheR